MYVCMYVCMYKMIQKLHKRKMSIFCSFQGDSSYVSHFLPTVPFIFVRSLSPPLYAVAKLDETRYRIERAITASSRVGARLLTRLYIAETLNCTTQRELTPAKTISSSDALRGRAAKNI